jgi:hypothetical protein
MDSTRMQINCWKEHKTNYLEMFRDIEEQKHQVHLQKLACLSEGESVRKANTETLISFEKRIAQELDLS